MADAMSDADKIVNWISALCIVIGIASIVMWLIVDSINVLCVIVGVLAIMIGISLIGIWDELRKLRKGGKE